MQPRWREKRASGPESEAAESTVATHGSPVRDKTGSDPPLGALRSGITGRSCHTGAAISPRTGHLEHGKEDVSSRGPTRSPLNHGRGLKG